MLVLVGNKDNDIFAELSFQNDSRLKLGPVTFLINVVNTSYIN